MSGKQEYYEITLSEFEGFLNETFAEYSRVQTANANENVYSIDLPKGTLSIRIYSTIEGRTSRDCGEDSIKILLWHDIAEEPVSGKKRTNRLPNWQEKVQEKLEELLLNYRQHLDGICPECDDAMITKTIGPFKKYLECPSCGYQTDY